MTKTLLTLLVACCASASFADTLYYHSTDLSHPDEITLRLNGQDENVIAGKLDFYNQNNNKLVTVCADLSRSLTGGALNYNSPVTTANLSNGLKLAGSIVADNFSVATTADEQAGLQIAVWSAIYNDSTTFDPNSGSLKFKNVNSSTLHYASEYYAAGKSHFGSALYYLGNGDHAQSQLSYAPVPEPMTLGVLAVGIVGLFIRRSRA